ncbi:MULTISPECIES: LPP20 family lipoprotein [Bacteroides]|uniref:LPP20 family lipoprotein n=1 Tax=Bacteroides TaxID=816 RepID=UPI001C37D1C8|nr:LPP20 family lipoprotein [Bacteroides cellulosilyticus]MBV3635558.1 LPP20 family lipoprotein [Bacteroides cellulosilyticus]MBV3662029.1 LPP20 family lipoprotein [Bacteroides cellulosilyticus]MBV3684150.1 LPP20 family lipoprotein [Bacteroides cellulosilyticus]MBV3692561.1 LPP20 family lipoprotein [Bacteroides cellulosilyticus]MBV3706197.1 LPP20 family lipoprotein [Bacteroides cellulosilyticus]
MKRSAFIIVTFLFIALAAKGQSIEEIQTSKDYIWGTGNAASLKKADNEALAALISQISTNVSSKFEQLTEGGTDGDKATVDETFKSVINTYSRATLNNTRRIVIQNEPEAVVMRYIKVAEIQRIFDGRKTKILDFAQEAIRAEKKAQVADALRYYYWALVLLQSYPDGNFLTMKDEEGKDLLLTTWIPKQMNDIFSNLKVSMESTHLDGDLKTINLKVLYKGQPARNYDYTYFDGRDWSNIFSAKDGTGIVELPVLANARNLQLRTEYMFEGEANIDNELSEVMGTVNPITMRNCALKLEGDEPKPGVEKAEDVQLAGTDSATTTNNGIRFLSTMQSAAYEDTMKKVESSIRTRNYDGIQDLCTKNGYDMFNSLIKYGQAKIVSEPQFKFLECNGEVTCRSLPLSFKFKSNQRTFVEDVVFTLNKEGKIDCLSFGLNKPAVDDIMNQTSWNDTVRNVLINFLESYKTAYALKRYDYINSIFSDDALIITGSVLKHTVSNEGQAMSKQAVKYTRQTKSEYMKKLQHIFRSSEFINLRFADNQVRKSGVGGEIYGIQIKQDYFSSSYGDTGYLFLMVDLNNPKEPVIHVRTWQPEKDPDFGLIDLSHF